MQIVFMRSRSTRYIKSCCVWKLCLLVLSTLGNFYMYIMFFNIFSFFTILQFPFRYFSSFFFFFDKIGMICWYVVKDNHCMLASLPQYMELSLILHYMRDGFIDYKSFLLNNLSHLITFYLKYSWKIWN